MINTLHLNPHDAEYSKALHHVLTTGERNRSDRTGVSTISTFGVSTRYNLRQGFPLLTTKEVNWNAVVTELLWFIEGSNDERRLCELRHGTRDPSKKTIWTQNANAPYWIDRAKFVGDVGPVYGVQWRSWSTSDGRSVDQLTNVINLIKTDPYSRRMILSAWNVGEIGNMALPPCHVLAQFYVADVESEPKLSCALYQRSNDMFLGCPFNIASYALLTHMVAHVCGIGVGDFVHQSGDTHIYSNHEAMVLEQLSRTSYPAPTLVLNPQKTSIDDFNVDDIQLIGYNSHPRISAPMAL